jgi:hypothetical protein
MQYQANPSTNFFQTSYVALPWVLYSPYISRFCGDRLSTKTLQSPAVLRTLLKPFSRRESTSANHGRFNNKLCGLRTVLTENPIGIWKQVRNSPNVSTILLRLSLLQSVDMFVDDIPILRVKFLWTDESYH